MNNKQIKTTKYKKIKAPFGYFGSKNNLAIRLCKDLPPHNCWVEAFCGSASITLAKPPAPIEIINDIDSEIVNFFEQLRDNYDELCRVIYFTPFSSEELSKARMEDKSRSDLERARCFLIQSMMAINGVFGEEKGGFSISNSYSRNGREARVNRWYNLPDRLSNVVERLKDVRIENVDARKLIKKYLDRPATLIYLDPPYFAKRTNGYNIDANNYEFHEELLDLVNQAKCMIFISGYENELYELKLTQKLGWKKVTIDTSTKDSKGNNHKRTEVVWMNKYYQEAQKLNMIPITLTEKEKKNNKLNPVRN